MRLPLAVLPSRLATTSAISPPLGTQTLSAPFVFTTWLMLALGWIEDRFSALAELAPQALSPPRVGNAPTPAVEGNSGD